MATSIEECCVSDFTNAHLTFPVLNIAQEMVRKETNSDGTDVIDKFDEQLSASMEGNVENVGLSIASGRETTTVEEMQSCNLQQSELMDEHFFAMPDPNTELLNSQCIDVQSGACNITDSSTSGQEPLFIPRSGLVTAEDGLSLGTYIGYAHDDTMTQPDTHMINNMQNPDILNSVGQFSETVPPINYQNYYPQDPYGQQTYQMFTQYNNSQQQGYYIPNYQTQVQEYNNFSQNVWQPLNVPFATNGYAEPSNVGIPHQKCMQNSTNHENLGSDTPQITQAWSQGTPNAVALIDESDIVEIKDKLRDPNLMREVKVETNRVAKPACVSTVAPAITRIALQPDTTVVEVDLAPPSFYQNIPPPHIQIAKIAKGAAIGPRVVAHVAAVATKPSGDKVFIPLDHDMYEIKQHGHGEDEMPVYVGADAFKKESELFGYEHSPRPIQLKGSISDEDASESDYTTDASKSSTSVSTQASENDIFNDMIEHIIADATEECEIEKEPINVRADKDDRTLVTVESKEMVILPHWHVSTEAEKHVIQTSGTLDECTADIDSEASVQTVVVAEVEFTDSPQEVTAHDAPTSIENANEIIKNSVAEVQDRSFTDGMQESTMPVDPENTTEFGETAEEHAQTQAVTIENNAQFIDNAAQTQVPMAEYTAQVIDPTGMYQTYPLLPDAPAFYATQGAMAWSEPQSTESTQWFTQPQDNSSPAPQPMESPIGEAYHFNNSWHQHSVAEPSIETVATPDDAQEEFEALTEGERRQCRPTFPALHISDDGLVTVILRYGVFLEMTTDKALRLVCHDRKLVVAMDQDGSSACLIHPAAKVYQCGTTIDADLYLARKAKIMTESTVFGNNFNTYVFDYSQIDELEGFAGFADQSEDRSVGFLVTDTGFFNFEVALRTSEIVSRAYFEKYQTNGCKVIVNGVKIVQGDNGDVSVYSGPIRFLRMSPLKSILRLRSQFLEADIETNWNVKIRRGSHTLNASYLGLILSNGKIKACIDQKQKLQAYVLPDHRRIYLGERVPQPRPGVPRQRYINLPQRRREPEGDHWGYTRHEAQ